MTSKNFKKYNHGISIGNKNISSLLFADDVVLMTNNAKDLHYLINGMAAFSLQWGLVVNTGKTDRMFFLTKLRVRIIRITGEHECKNMW